MSCIFCKKPCGHSWCIDGNSQQNREETGQNRRKDRSDRQTSSGVQCPTKISYKKN